MTTTGEKWNHMVFFGNNHVDTPRWAKYPVRCLVVYEIGTRKGQFWERKRSTSELHLETNTPKQRTNHVELYIIEKLNEEVKDYKMGVTESFDDLSITENVRLLVKITIYISVTPCLSCAKSLISFKKKLEDEGYKVELKIIFSALYKLKRQSCLEKSCRHKKVQSEDHTDNIKGIKQLKESGIELAPFGREDWKFLKNKILEEIQESMEETLQQREQEDKDLKNDFELLLKKEISE